MHPIFKLLEMISNLFHLFLFLKWFIYFVFVAQSSSGCEDRSAAETSRPQRTPLSVPAASGDTSYTLSNVPIFLFMSSFADICQIF